MASHMDAEKQVHHVSQERDAESGLSSPASPEKHEAHTPPQSRFRRITHRIISHEAIEKKSIERVGPEERQPAGWLHDAQIFFLWMSANITLNNLAVAILGPTLFGLGWADCVMCVVVGTLIGGATTAYMSIFGAKTGLRTMVVTRFYMGYWPAKIPALLNVVLMLGYCTIDAIIAGQVLSAVSGDENMTIAVGIIIVSIIVLFIGLCGMRIFHQYERIAWLPQMIVLFILIGIARSNFDTTLQSTGDDRAIAANRISFLSLIYYVPNSWAAAASDFYVYYPEKTSRVKIFLLTWAGISIAFLFVNLIGVALATGILLNSAWSDAYAVSSGALIVEAFSPLGGFGKFCAVVVALGVIANSVPGTYAASLDLQTTGRFALKVPRWIWIVVQVIIQLACGIAGRDNLLIIFTNFLALMGYWLTITIAIVFMEQVIFQRGKPQFNWDLWNDQKALPIGAAAFASFLIGWVGAVIGMFQVYFVGPLAAMIGDAGADVGVWVALGLTIVSYPVLRFVEIKLGWNRRPY